MNIHILGHRRAVEFLKHFPNKYDVIFISGPENPFGVEGSEQIPGLAKECLQLLFDDVTYPVFNLKPPQRHHVEEALKFAKGRENLVVSCQMGVSRSAAIAYVILASEVGSVKALDILDSEVHMPNSIIVRHASAIMVSPDIVDVMNRWKNDADELQSETGPSLF